LEPILAEASALSEQVEFPDREPVRLLQITDTHLMAEAGGRLLNVDTDASLAAVVRLAATRDPATALLITGDIAGDGAAAAYQRLDDALRPLQAPSFWLPGNHDEVAQIQGQWSHRFRRRLRFPHWDVVMLDSQKLGEVGGHLDDQELAWLARAVDDVNAHGRHLLVALHHPLTGLECAWLDEQQVANGDRALTMLEGCEREVVVVSGHVHQESERQRGRIRLLTTPSTCVQFAPRSDDFLADSCNPGLRELVLYADGRCETQVHRVTDEVFPVDLESGGYL
jgi:Icc protein